MKRPLLLLWCLLGVVTLATAQSELDEPVFARGKDAKLAPRLGLGTGFFTYLGDLRDNNFSHPFTSSWGYEFRASANISRHFDLELDIIYGDITVNERSREPFNNRNFRSELFVGGVGVSYNFNHLYKKAAGIVQPFVSVGVAFVHFDSKTDLFDADGNRYHYWTDGSIMDRPENSETAWQAQELQRDYTYETDLRHMNNDGLGKYDLFTFAIPVKGGLDFKMGRRLSTRLGVGFYYTFTDLIDDATWRGSDQRQESKDNDMFLYTSLSVAYSFGSGNREKTQKSDYFEGMDVLALNLADSDGDGVPDFEDMCAQTPEGAKVDEFGCALDTDRDLIQDYRDQEEFTGADKIANLKGIGLTDEMIWERYIDSIATERARIHLIYPSGIMGSANAVSSNSNTSQAITQQVAVPIEEKVVSDPVKADIKPDAKSSEKVKTATAANPQPVKASEPTKRSSTPERDDMKKLNAVMAEIASEAGKPSSSGMLMDEIANEIFSGDPENASNVSDVYDAAYKVYGRMVDEGRIAPGTRIDITRNAPASTAIPERFVLADVNGDGLITSDEVLRAIEEIMDGNSIFTVAELLDLVTFYKDKMADARVVDFGGTMAVYVDGKLNILPNYKDDGLTANQRFLVRKYPDADYNGDGRLTPDEVNRLIKEFKEGSSSRTAEDINTLIDLFFED